MDFGDVIQVINRAQISKTMARALNGKRNGNFTR